MHNILGDHFIMLATHVSEGGAETDGRMVEPFEGSRMRRQCLSFRSISFFQEGFSTIFFQFFFFYFLFLSTLLAI